MDRRSAILALLATPAAFAQTAPRSVQVVLFRSRGGGIGAGTHPEIMAAFVGAFAEHGFVQGRNLAFSIREAHATDDEVRLEEARRLVESRPDVIIVEGTADSLRFKRLTRSIPVVFWNVADPVLSGVVASFNRPGANLTGVSNRTVALAGKRLEVLAELRPTAKKFAVLYANPVVRPWLSEEFSTAARRLGVQLIDIDVVPTADPIVLGDAIRAAGAEGIIDSRGVTETVESSARMYKIVQRSGQPSIHPWAEPVLLGEMLLALGPREQEALKPLVELASRILKGESPAGLPVDQASRVYLTVNLRAARKLGISVPVSILARADRIVE